MLNQLPSGHVASDKTAAEATRRFSRVELGATEGKSAGVSTAVEKF